MVFDCQSILQHLLTLILKVLFIKKKKLNTYNWQNNLQPVKFFFKHCRRVWGRPPEKIVLITFCKIIYLKLTCATKYREKVYFCISTGK